MCYFLHPCSVRSASSFINPRCVSCAEARFSCLFPPSIWLIQAKFPLSHSVPVQFLFSPGLPCWLISWHGCSQHGSSSPGIHLQAWLFPAWQLSSWAVSCAGCRCPALRAPQGAGARRTAAHTMAEGPCRSLPNHHCRCHSQPRLAWTPPASFAISSPQ